MGLFGLGGGKKKARKSSGKKKASKGNRSIGAISKRASRLYRAGKAKTWKSALKKAAKG